jgi:NADPH:quinone reductase
LLAVGETPQGVTAARSTDDMGVWLGRWYTGETVPKRVVISSFGETPLEALENYASLEDEPLPDPSSLGAGDVIVEIKSASVGWVDLLMMSGQYQHMPKPPYCPGLEYAGVVSWAGTEVDHVAVGDAVLVDPFVAGPRSHGAYQRYGGFASHAVAPAQAVLRVPGRLSFDEACNLLEARSRQGQRRRPRRE